MNVHEDLKIFGLLSVLITWLAITYILLRRPRDAAKSISHHAATGDKDYKIFAVLMTLGVISMLVFMTLWLVPVFRLPVIFTVIALLAVVLELIATWVPLTTGRKYVIHQGCSYGAAFLIPVILLLLAFSEGLPDAPRYISLAAVILMLTFMALFKLAKKTRDNYLWFQSLYVLAFHISLLAVAYLGD